MPAPPGKDLSARPPACGAPRYLIETWGCQMNSHDSERMAAVLAAQGMTPAAGEGHADLILLTPAPSVRRPQRRSSRASDSSEA